MTHAAMTKRERNLLCAAENLLGSWAVARATADATGDLSTDELMVSGLIACLAGLTRACDAYPDEVLTRTQEDEGIGTSQ